MLIFLTIYCSLADFNSKTAQFQNFKNLNLKNTNLRNFLTVNCSKQQYMQEIRSYLASEEKIQNSFSHLYVEKLYREILSLRSQNGADTDIRILGTLDL